MKHTSTIIIVLALLMLGASCAKQSATLPTSTTGAQDSQLANTATDTTDTFTAGKVTWMQTGSGWQAHGEPPACPTPILHTPVTLSAVSSILYPGQTRGGNYKAHGGFRFDELKNNAATITVPLDAMVIDGARYIEGGEIQYLFDFENTCGIRYRFDHLHTLSPVFTALAEQLPAANVDDSRTTNFNNPVTVKAGDVIATAVGFLNTKNASVDFGVYDLRQRNVASQSSSFVSAHTDNPLALNGVCWLDMFSSVDAATVKSLPAADQLSGKKSDYCS